MHFGGSYVIWGALNFEMGLLTWENQQKIHTMGKIPPKSYCSLRSIQHKAVLWAMPFNMGSCQQYTWGIAPALGKTLKILTAYRKCWDSAT